MKLNTFINRPVLSTVISIILVILGLIGLVTLPIEQYPDVAPPTISVRATYQGANAETVLNSVIAPLEEQINGVEGMTYMTSTASNDGSAEIHVYFNLGTNADMAAVNVQNRVARATSLLPQEVTQTGVITQKQMTSMLMVFTIYSENPAFDEAFVQNYAKINVLPPIMRIYGVGNAMAWGSRDYSMRLWLKPDVMATYGLTPSDISAALAEQNIEAAPGQFGQQGNQSFQYTIKYKGRLKTPEEFENIVIRADKSGSILRMKDIARVELGGLDYSMSTQSQGKPAVTIVINQSPGSNATEVVNNIKALMAEQVKSFPTGLKYATLLDTTDFLYASIDKVVETIIEAFILVFIVVYVFLQDFRSTLIPAISVVVSLVGTLFFLKVFGFSLNLLTLFALVLAIAIVVDDAIVVVEAVHAKLDEGYQSAHKASIDAMGEISGAIVSITLVMSAVFIPVTFIGGTTGVFYTQFGMTLAIAIVISAINALTLSPALCAVFLSAKGEHGKGKSFASRFHGAFNVFFEAFKNKYERLIGRMVHRKWLSFGIVAVMTAVLFFLLKTTPSGLIPNEDNGVFFVDVSLAPGTSLERTGQVLNEIDSLLADNPMVESRTKVEGMGIISGNGSSNGVFICKLIPWEDRTEKSQSLTAITQNMQMAISAKVKDASIMIFSPPAIPGFSASGGFEFSLQDKTGGSITDFMNVANQFMGAAFQRPEILYAATTFKTNYPQYMADIDVGKAKIAGTSPAQILGILQGYYGGLYASNFNEFGKLYRVMIQADTMYRKDPASLSGIYIRNGQEMAPITNFVTLRKVYGPQNINRFNLFTSIPFNGQPKPGYSSGQAIAAVQQVAKEVLPVGYGYEFSGLTREEQSSSNQIGFILILCLVFVYFILCALYESYILPLTVIVSLPLGLAGTFLFARMMGVNNDIYLQTALIMLIGLLAKNAILIVQFALARRENGETIVQAAIDGAAARLRPILMTSLAMVVGLLPLMFASGVGANGNRTIGAGAVGGMLIGTIFQLIVVPSLFVVFQSLQERFKKIEPVEADAE